MTSFNRFIFEHRALLLALFVSLAIKALLLLQDPVVNRDAVLYIAAAESFSQGNFSQGVEHYRMPLYPLLLTAFHFFVPNWILAGQLLHAFFLLFSLIPLYFLTLNLFNRSAAFFTALLFAVVPVFNGVGSITRDPPFLFLVLCALALLSAEGGKFSARRFLLVGVLVVVATFIRIEGIVLLGLLPVMLLWQYRKQLSTKKIVKISAATGLSIGFLLLVVWVINVLGFATQSRLSDIFIWFNRLQTFDTYFALMDFLREIQSETPGGNLKNNLIAKARHFAPIIYSLGLLEILIKEVFPTSVLALWALRWREESLFNSPRSIIVWPWIAFVVVNLLFCLLRNFTVTRYMWLPIVLTLPFVGYGISLWWDRYNGKVSSAVVLMMIFFAVPATKALSDLGKDQRDSIRQAGHWLVTHDSEKNLKILFNDRRLSLYANRAQEHNNRINEVVTDGSIVDTFSESGADLVVLYFSGEVNDFSRPKGYSLLISFKDSRSFVLVLSKVHDR